MVKKIDVFVFVVDFTKWFVCQIHGREPMKRARCGQG